MQTYEKQFLECLDLRGVSLRTKKDYFRRLKPLEKYYSKDPTTLSIKQVRQYFIYLIRVKKLSPATLKAAFYSIRFFYLHVVGFDEKDFSFYKQKIEKKLPVVISTSDVKLILSKVRILDYRILLSLMYQCGLRISEAVNVKIADIDGNLKTITIRNSKGNKDRAVPLPDKFLIQLRTYWRTHRNKLLLFPKRNSKYNKILRSKTKENIPIRTIQKVMKLAVQEAGILKKATPHTLRHSYATNLLENGVNINNVQRYLGHKSLRATIRYLQLTNTSTKESVKIINNMMSVL